MSEEAAGPAGDLPKEPATPAAAAAPHPPPRPQPGSWPRLALRSRLACLALAGVVVAAWLLDVSGHGVVGGREVARAAGRLAAPAALAAGCVWLLAAALSEIMRGIGGGIVSPRAAAGESWRRSRAAVLPALVLLSLAVRLAGIDSEVTGRYYLDEGTYYHHASRIDDGEPLLRSFVYPHFTYYADALTLWLAARFPAAVASSARTLYGLEEPLAVSWLLLRLVVALLSAATVVPVFRIAERISSPAAAALAAVLVVLSDLYNEGSHLNICDLPAAFFATLCLLFAARLLDVESARDYVLAGVAAGLAAGSKYPAGFVALAVVAVWLRWRIARRDLRPDLLWAGLAAAATVLLVMPSLLVYPESALWGKQSILFGARQYGRHGWLGVLPGSNLGFYADQLAWSFGVPALVLGGSGLLFLGRRRVARLLWLAPFPAVFFLLIVSMNMAVKRNLYPIIPMLAVFLGVGIARWLELLAPRPAGAAAPCAAERPAQPASRRALLARFPLLPGRVRRPLRWLAAAAVLALTLWPAADLTARQTIGFVTPTTREAAAAWIGAHLPAGAAIVKELYTPDFPPHRFAVAAERFVGRIPIPDLRGPDNDYVLLSSAAYSRFRDPAALFTDNQRQIARRYEEIFTTFPLVREWIPGELQLGPVLRLYRIDPDPAACQPRPARLAAAEAFVPDDGMREAPGRPLRYSSPEQWSLFRRCLPAGRYLLTLEGDVRQPARLRVADLSGAAVAQISLASPAPPPAAPAPATLSLPKTAKYFLYVYLGPGSSLRQLTVIPLHEPR
ncbi:MAG TPA: glycosyltransferase family 39 protein [Thermoanaerobaculia bacterium]|nr:glycosyltransferase family 39 protein [Thermoanaerobaculia bacterium]